MNKPSVNEQIKAAGCIDGGSKEAAIKVRAVLEGIEVVTETLLLLDKSGVDIEDFLQSVRKLVAYAEFKRDTSVPLFYCEEDCAVLSYHKCRFKPFTFKEGTKICPHYFVEDK
ncbi:MAG: hypothetical protein IJ272_01365 [Clostridia bacterium]|nr:hypothetical protein [Clostridia bacterium]